VSRLSTQSYGSEPEPRKDDRSLPWTGRPLGLSVLSAQTGPGGQPLLRFRPL